ncbi:glutamate ABC transporter substrate-binding protein [Amycolatopsis viridis]|uniref:Glutamate transport system substrate-binding protein n=1 Tax=Amycolatopsis viridis TaxID=185678 RepID=A0ABX0SMT3_9PSEU|nr:glutamate ABC transporter substrate-binding protein [Amycolatopsis viridis]NIH78288.1 glutamate transport system substrate-binding protein [Amycolatopsis viridis]
MTAPARPRRLAALLTAIALSAATACSSSGGAVPPAGGGGQEQNLLDRAPVASDADLATSPTAQAIKQRGQILIGSQLDTPLLSQQNPTTGQTEGFDAILGRLLAKYILGRPNVKIVNSTSQIREALLQNNTVDVVLHTYSITPARAEKVSFAGPYFMSGPAIMARKGDSAVTKPQDLKGKRVLAVTNSTGMTLAQQYQPAEMVTLGTNAECVTALEQGRGDVYVNDLTQLAGNAQTNDKVQINTGTFGQDPYGIGIHHGDDTFKQFVNAWLEKIQAAGLWQEAYRQTLGTVIPGDVPAPPKTGSVPGS